MLSNLQAKAMAAFLSGEMKDTVQMNPAGAYGESCLVYLFFVLAAFLMYPRSVGKVLLSKRTPQTLPQLVWER